MWEPIIQSFRFDFPSYYGAIEWRHGRDLHESTKYERSSSACLDGATFPSPRNNVVYFYKKKIIIALFFKLSNITLFTAVNDG